MQKDFRKWANWAIAFLLCFSLVVNIHCVMLVIRYQQIYQAPPVWVSETGETIKTESDVIAPSETKNNESTPSAEAENAVETEQPTEPNNEETKEADSKESPATAGTTVYLTKSGSKYHRDGCSSLSKSKIAISYEDAVSRGFDSCGRCNP